LPATRAGAEAMAGKIFINYRRGDDPGYTQALYQQLEAEFTARDLFMDVEGQIRPGDDFVEVLNRQVAACDVLLVVIGPRWAELLAERAGDRDDFVVIEIEAGLVQGKRVIPVLVSGSVIPRTENLPAPIQALARRNAVGLRPERFRSDCLGLVTALKDQLAAAEAERNASEAARRASEAQARAPASAAMQRSPERSSHRPIPPLWAPVIEPRGPLVSSRGAAIFVFLAIGAVCPHRHRYSECEQD
jgi:TIR domain